MDEYVGAFLVLSLILLFIKALHPQREQQEEAKTDFDFLSLREQIATAKKTSDQVLSMEQLRTDIEESCEDDLMIVCISWVGRDGDRHEYDLYCNGEDKNSECLGEAIESEIYSLRQALAHQCAVLSRQGRSGKNSGKNGRSLIGEWYEKAMSALRSGY